MSETEEKLRKKLKSLEEIYDFQIEMGEDTSIVLGKIQELKSVIKDKYDS